MRLEDTEALLTFRFHTGSIKSIETNMQEIVDNAFRFHTGSIKSLRDFHRFLRRKNSFDSILVRLKVKALNILEINSDRFRFHTGSIKSRIRRTPKRNHRQATFRFHTGSIKSVKASYPACDNLRRFDSILVRLKVVQRITNAVAALGVSIPYWFD